MSLDIIPIEAENQKWSLGSWLKLRFWDLISEKFFREESIQDFRVTILKRPLRKIARVSKEKRFLPALTGSVSSQSWNAYFNSGCRKIAERVVNRPGPFVTQMVRDLAFDLVRANFTGSTLENSKIRREIRTFLCHQLSMSANSMRRRGMKQDALEAYSILESLGNKDSLNRNQHAKLLWETGDRSSSAMGAYLRYLLNATAKQVVSEKGGSVPIFEETNVQEEILEFVKTQVVIDERVPLHLLSQKMLFNQVLLSRCKIFPDGYKYLGMGYLRLGKPERSLYYFHHWKGRDQEEEGLRLFYLGQALFKTENFDEAAKYFDQAQQYGVEIGRIASWKGFAYAKAGRWDIAVQTFEQGEAELGSVLDPEFYIQWARACFLVGKLHDAKIRYRRSLQIDPTNIRAELGLAICLEQLGRHAEAMELLEQGVKRDMSFGPACYFLGRLLELDGRKKEAVNQYQQAHKLNPQDLEYLLSLGLVLHDLGDPRGVGYLEAAARMGHGGSEVFRRLAESYFRLQDLSKTRYWLEQMAKVEPVSNDVVWFRARILATQATKEMNNGHFETAVALWEEIQEKFSNEPQVIKQLASSLLCDAVEKWKAGKGDAILENVHKANDLSPSFDSRFYVAVSFFLRGEYHTAYSHFTQLRSEVPHHKECQIFHFFSANLIGEKTEGFELPETQNDFSDFRGIISFLPVFAAAFEKKFSLAAEKLKLWVENVEVVKSLEWAKYSINILAAYCNVRGTQTPKIRLVRMFEKLNLQYGNEFWTLAVVMTKILDVSSVGIPRAAQADKTKLDKCLREIEALLEEEKGEKPKALTHLYQELIKFYIAYAISIGDLALAISQLKEIINNRTFNTSAFQEILSILVKKIDQPSHEKAMMALNKDPLEAKQTWETLLNSDPHDHVAIQHLACMAWTKAHDEMLAGNIEESISHWDEGLRWYIKLHQSQAYWDHLLKKAKKLDQPNLHPYDPHAFELWKSDADYFISETILKQIFHILIGVEAPDGKLGNIKPIQLAKKLMWVIHGSALQSTFKKRLQEDLAKHFLDPHPENITNYEASINRAHLVLDVDSENVKAKEFIIRATVHQVDRSEKEGDRNWSSLVERLKVIERHVMGIEKKVSELGEDGEGLKVPLAMYYELIGNFHHNMGQDAVDLANKAQSPDAQNRYLQGIQNHYRESDDAYNQSLKYDPINPTAKKQIELHHKEYKAIQKILSQPRY